MGNNYNQSPNFDGHSFSFTCSWHDGIDCKAPAPTIHRSVTDELPLQLIPRDAQLTGPVRPFSAWQKKVYPGIRCTPSFNQQSSLEKAKLFTAGQKISGLFQPKVS
jgi:hypothetical protein